jgi:anti-sigma factor RsiW
MKCLQIQESMPDLATGLSPVTPELEQHLSACADCAGKFEELRRTMALLDEWQAPEPSPYFDTRLQARLREERAQQPAGWLQWVRKPALAICFLAVMVVSVTLVRNRSGNGGASHGSNGGATVAADPGTAVGDLQALDDNHDLYSDFEELDDLQVQQDVTANP